MVFELTAGGVEKVLHRFTGPKNGDGIWPLAGVVRDESTGNLYGTTELGGTGPCTVNHHRKGCGTVFQLSPPPTKHGRWSETTLHSFNVGGDGYYPDAGLVRDAQTGDLYGATSGGGTYSYGVVFKLTP